VLCFDADKGTNMASRPTEDVLGPPTAPDKSAGADYENDFYTWSLDQARLLRAGQWAQIDRENVAEEIESLGREQFNKLESAFRVILIHMLKWDHQVDRRSRSWILSIESQRVEAEHVIDDNPGLKPRITEAMARAYRRARIDAANETGLGKAIFPDTCPYVFEDIMSREF
jgi:Domain of unknown function DUF29